MKTSEVPDSALTTPPTPVPTKEVYDWDALYEIMLQQGFVIIESDRLRTNVNGVDENVLVKMFNSHLRTTRKIRLRTRRISKTRWFCTVG